MKKKNRHTNLYATACAVARGMVTDRRRFAPRIVEDKRRKEALKPKYRDWVV